MRVLSSTSVPVHGGRTRSLEKCPVLIKQSLEVVTPVDLHSAQAYRGHSAPSGLSSQDQILGRQLHTRPEAGVESWEVGKLGSQDALSPYSNTAKAERGRLPGDTAPGVGSSNVQI